jgi:multicomponent Na+:H+ antiporter subunit C
MDAFRLLELLILVAMLVGFVGLLLRRNLFLKVLAMDVMGSAVVALFVLVAARAGLQSPILAAPLPPGSVAAPLPMADPIPQAVILTAIVIGLSIQALLLVVITRLARVDPSLDLASFDAGRPDGARRR